MERRMLFSTLMCLRGSWPEGIEPFGMSRVKVEDGSYSQRERLIALTCYMIERALDLAYYFGRARSRTLCFSTCPLMLSLRWFSPYFARYIC